MEQNGRVCVFWAISSLPKEFRDVHICLIFPEENENSEIVS